MVSRMTIRFFISKSLWFTASESIQKTAKRKLVLNFKTFIVLLSSILSQPYAGFWLAKSRKLLSHVFPVKKFLSVHLNLI